MHSSAPRSETSAQLASGPVSELPDIDSSLTKDALVVHGEAPAFKREGHAHHKKHRRHWKKKAKFHHSGTHDDGKEEHITEEANAKLTTRAKQAIATEEDAEEDQSEGSKSWYPATVVQPSAGVARSDGKSNAAGLLPPVKPEHVDDVTWTEEGSSFQLYEENVSANDIKQGQLGDCWFLSSLAALAEYPHLIKAVFKDKHKSEEGTFTMIFCKSGRWIEVEVDDRLPLKDGTPIYAHSDNELWVILLEKAFAKLHGSYDAIAGGLPNEAMVDLTGAPGMSYPFSHKDVAPLVADGGQVCQPRWHQGSTSAPAFGFNFPGSSMAAILFVSGPPGIMPPVHAHFMRTHTMLRIRQ
ncbi:hypothetical protein CYMTET_23493 [Cymbomonas tetramitiformis]|uniref:Calpain catalytic domain-containing protein n=1 Tax=Cymbomonas tetramitiformis TaxID=36881 RepID=A0AAE0L0V3_9CHLO|nr:hypothetical protein CYMTET_23493 [Cymbomonas tetramitiformis]